MLRPLGKTATLKYAHSKARDTHLVELATRRERMLKSVSNTKIYQVRQRLNDYFKNAEIALIGFAVEK